MADSTTWAARSRSLNLFSLYFQTAQFPKFIWPPPFISCSLVLFFQDQENQKPEASSSASLHNIVSLCWQPSGDLAILVSGSAAAIARQCECLLWLTHTAKVMHIRKGQYLRAVLFPARLVCEQFLLGSLCNLMQAVPQACLIKKDHVILTFKLDVFKWRAFIMPFSWWCVSIFCTLIVPDHDKDTCDYSFTVKETKARQANDQHKKPSMT